jgi:hypothetical protein
MDKADARLNHALFAKLLFDCMFSAAFAESMRETGFDVAEARHLPKPIQRNDYALFGKSRPRTASFGNLQLP